MSDANKDLLERYLKETKATSKAKSFGDLVERMRSEQQFRKILESLSDNVRSEEIFPFLMGGGEGTVESPPDFLVRKDEIRLPIFLVETKAESDYTILKRKIEGFVQYLKRTDMTEAVIAWMQPPDFPSLCIRVEELERMVKDCNDFFKFTNLHPFRETIIESIKSKDAVWPVPKFGTLPQITESETLIKTLKESFEKTFHEEVVTKKPHLSYKRQALESIASEDTEQIFQLVVTYMKGEITLQDFATKFRLISRVSRDSTA